MHDPAPESIDGLARPRGGLPTIGGKYFALAVLFAMNLLNYVDRYSFFAAGKHVQEALSINDYWFSVLGVSFMIVYTIVSPVMGWLGDRYNRKMLLAGGVGLWSCATVFTAFSLDFYHMFFWRALLGLGEASYGAIAPALISDLFPSKERGRAMGAYFLALPLGSALGYAIGGTVADRWGWQAVFFIVGAPGLLAALAGLLVFDPGRGAAELEAENGNEAHGGGGDGGAVASADRPRWRDYLVLFRTPTFLYNTAGMAAVTFATGAYAAWGPIFYQRVYNISAEEAGVKIGLLMAVAGLLGIALGMVLPDLLRKATRRAYLLFAAAAVIVAAPLVVLGVLDHNYNMSLAFLFGASVLLAMVLGPCNTVTANVVPADRRATGYATFIFLIHLFGDISSPLILGWLSIRFGRPEVAASSVGRFLESIGTKVVETPEGPTNLSVAMLAVLPMLILAFVFFLLGSHHLPADEDAARAASGGHGAGEPGAGVGHFH